MALLNFDSTQVAPAEAPEAIPAGWYVVQMSASEMKPTSNGEGAYLNCEYTILAPAEYANRRIFDRLNLQNKNVQAVEIAYRQLSAICHATGVIQVADSVQLHGRPLLAKVSLRPAGTGADGKHYDAGNEIKGYKAVEGARAAPQQLAYAPPPPVASSTPVWTPPPIQAAAPAVKQASTQAAIPPWEQQAPAAGQVGAPTPPWAKPA